MGSGEPGMIFHVSRKNIKATLCQPLGLPICYVAMG
jgi:hypothetical protein